MVDDVDELVVELLVLEEVAELNLLLCAEVEFELLVLVCEEVVELFVYELELELELLLVVE